MWRQDYSQENNDGRVEIFKRERSIRERLDTFLMPCPCKRLKLRTSEQQCRGSHNSESRGRTGYCETTGCASFSSPNSRTRRGPKTQKSRHQGFLRNTSSIYVERPGADSRYSDDERRERPLVTAFLEVHVSLDGRHPQKSASAMSLYRNREIGHG